MGRTYEILFQLAGKIDETFTGGINKAIKVTQQLDKRINQLETTQAKVTRFQALNQEILNTQQSFEKARDRVKFLAVELLRADQPINSLNRQLKEAQNRVNSLATEIKNAERPTEEMRLAYQDARMEVARLEKQLEKAESASRQLEQQFDKASSQADRLRGKLASDRDTLKNLRDELEQAGVSTKDLAQDSTRLTREIEKAERAQERYAQATARAEKVGAFRDSMRGNMFDAAQAAVGVAVPVMMAVNFESSMADVKKVVNFDTPQQFQQMNRDILELSKNIPMAADDISKIVAAAGQAGIARNELVGFADSAAKMGVAFDVPAEEAGKMMASWRIGFKMNQRQVVELADKINYLGNTAGAKADLISQVVTKIGPLGGVAGVASGEIAAMGATLLSVGVQEDIASTGIKNLMLAMTSGAAATKAQQQVFASLGMDATTVAAKMQKDAKGAIIEVLTAIQKLPKARQAAALTDLFGKESVGAIAPLLSSLDTLQKNFGRVADQSQYAGSMQKEFEARSATTANSLQLFKNNAAALSITLGSVLLPSLNAGTKKLSVLVDKVADFTEKHPGLTRGLVLGTTALLGSALAFSVLGYAVSTTILPFVRFAAWAKKVELASKLSLATTRVWTGVQWLWNGAMSVGNKVLSVGRLVAYKAASIAVSAATRVWTAVQWALNVALNANPIGLVVAGIALLVGGIVLLYKKSETARRIMDKMWKGLKSGAATAINFAINRINKLIDLMDKIPGIKISKISNMPLPKTAKVGHNATGTNNWGGGFTWVGERGPELVNLPQGSRVIPTNRISKGGVNITYAPQITVPGGGPNVQEQVNQGLRAGFNEFKAWFDSMQRQEARLNFAD